MHVTTATVLALHCTLCLAIRVPVVWDDDNSEVKNNNQFAADQFKPQHFASSNQKPIPVEYFEYTAQKPKFAVEIAKFHGVQSPEEHYKSYPVKPHTGVPGPELGKQKILDQDRNIFRPYQEYVKKNEAIRTVIPSKTSYEVFHPYKQEEPELKKLYQDPVMEKIRNDIANNQIRLQKYENEAGKPDIRKGEYLESPEETDRKKTPQRNVPSPYEIYKPQRRPVYYRLSPLHHQREQALNQKLRHPWHENHIKIKPIHYRPVKNHLQKLRQQHALKYDDEKNEYPSLDGPEEQDEPPEGYDIYEKGRAKFLALRNNADESLNEAVVKNKPIKKHNIELSEDEPDESNEDEQDNDDFVPVKNYAQVRKTETTKHLPKEAAYEDAETLEEIKNAPRLREAIKSSKAQTVYSEEGYEDSAYDHAGEQKHASDHEAHGGFLKEQEESRGKFKTPSLSEDFEDEEGAQYRNKILDGKQWKDTKQNTEKETELENYSEKEQESLDEIDIRNPENSENSDSEDEDGTNESNEEEIERSKREQEKVEKSNIDSILLASSHDVNKREVKIDIPEINLNKTEDEILRIKASLPQKLETLYEKYPYYTKNYKEINKDSPLRYAENLKLIPKKSEGGTEFYDSRSTLQCPEVDDNIDPIPEKLKKGGHPDDDDEGEHEDEEESNEEENSSKLKETSRLRGLGDKIDCFKVKYFGENPLDSPFFKEEIISNPEPVTIPSIDIYKLKWTKQQSTEEPDSNKQEDAANDLQEKGKIDVFTLVDKLYPKQNSDRLSIVASNNILNSQVKSLGNRNHTLVHDEGIITHLKGARKKRAAPFVYEPYKIIRDGQVQDSKKTTTTNNISPLIKQLQSSRVVDKVAINPGKDQIVKRNVGPRTYKDIGKGEREKNIESKGSQPLYDASFVDVSLDQRRGEPRYELRSANHKTEYSPVTSKTTIEDIKSHNNRKPSRRQRTTTTVRPYFDVSKFLPQEDPKKSYPTNGEIDVTSDQPVHLKLDKSLEKNDDSEENDDEEKSDNSKNIKTNAKPLTKRKQNIDVSTAVKPEIGDELPVTPASKLRLVTSLRDSYETGAPALAKNIETSTHNNKEDKKINVPKYREKKKKSRKSTLITNTNSYGEDDDDHLSEEEEVDALIGVNHNINEYLPTYEKEAREKHSSSDSHSESQEDDDGYEHDDHSYQEEPDKDDEEDEDDDDDDDDGGDDDSDDDNGSEEHDDGVKKEMKVQITTSAPPKNTLIRTTDAPLITTEARSAKLEIEPVVTKKKLEIHKELPVNRSSPHVTEYKQDIQEVEIIKEIPSRIRKKQPQKNIEALELYKDENLAKDINKLGGVEIFKEGLDLLNGPKHGGNYRSAEVLTDEDTLSSSQQRKQDENSSKGDVVASQSKTSKLIDVKDPYSRRRIDIQRARNNRNRSAKFIELSDSTERPTSRTMHGGNFKSIHDIRRRGGNRNAKIIELDDQPSREDHSTNKHVGNPRSYGSRGGERHQMHGGNYRSAKLVKADDNIKNIKAQTQLEDVTNKDSSINARLSSAVLLDSFAKAVPVLTTPPSYILDPSKRMYYFVDA